MIFLTCNRKSHFLSPVIWWFHDPFVIRLEEQSSFWHMESIMINRCRFNLFGSKSRNVLWTWCLTRVPLFLWYWPSVQVFQSCCCCCQGWRVEISAINTSTFQMRGALSTCRTVKIGSRYNVRKIDFSEMLSSNLKRGLVVQENIFVMPQNKIKLSVNFSCKSGSWCITCNKSWPRDWFGTVGAH